MKQLDFTKLANFQPKQIEAFRTFFDPKTKYLLYGGAASGGKSYWLRWTALAAAMYYATKYHIKGVPIGLFSEDYPTLKDRQIARIKREFPSYLGELKDNRDEGYVFQLGPNYGEGKILLRNLDDPSKYASTEFAAEFVEELTKNPEQTFEDLRFRLRYPGVPDPRFGAASNPGSLGHGYVKKYFIDKNAGEEEKEQDRFFYVPATVYDNSYVDESYIQQLKSLPEQKRKAYLEGSWDVFAGQYFPEFNRNTHVIAPIYPKAELPKVGGMDWGRTAPFVLLFGVMLEVKWEGRQFNRLVIYKEISGTEKSPKEWADIIKERQHMDEVKWIMGDPAMFTPGNDNSISIADQFKMEGVHIRRASNERIGGWELIHNWLRIAPDGLPYMLFTDNCSGLIRTLPQLIHDELNIEDVETNRKGNIDDDWGDGLRYLVKNLKWIDASVGLVTKSKRVMTNEPPHLRKQRSPLKGIDLDLFVE